MAAQLPASAVLFPTTQGQVLRPDQPAQLLQGFLNVMKAEGSTNGTLTQAQLNDYEQKRFFAVDPNGGVASYLAQNFGQIAKLDGNAQSISTGDLVQLHQGLPTPAPAPTPAPPPYQQSSQALQMMIQLMTAMMQMMMSFFGQH